MRQMWGRVFPTSPAPKTVAGFSRFWAGFRRAVQAAGPEKFAGGMEAGMGLLPRKREEEDGRNPASGFGQSLFEV